MTIGGLMTWTGGDQTGSGETIANGGVAISGGANKHLDSRTLTLNAPSTGFGDLRALNGATIENNSTLEIIFDDFLQHAGGAISSFINNDTVTKSAGAGEAELRINFFNTDGATVNVNTGTLTLGNNGGVANSEGDFVIAGLATPR